MAEPKNGPCSPEYLERLREIDDEVDAITAPSFARAARQWAEDDETLDDLVRRGVAVSLGCGVVSRTPHEGENS